MPSRHDIDRAMAISTGLDNVRVSDDDRSKAVRAVTGSQACKGADDAKLILEYLGLYEFAAGKPA